ncbi:hypothetical protein EYR40_009400 [Pleurotus pulmonarius]|nr:hypothetical protein EYR38_009499 [Pleurotus pulmonarius]KAF4590803.1 hypothetical protein EYR40_009400 [Pleurotus pulmonarius]
MQTPARGLKRAHTDENSFRMETPGLGSSKRRRARLVDITEVQNLQLQRAEASQSNQQAVEKAKIEAALTALKSAGFPTVFAFLDAVNRSKDQQISANFSRQLGHHGRSLLDVLRTRQPHLLESYNIEQTRTIINAEAGALCALLRPGDHASILDTLSSFSLDNMLRDAERAAPFLCQMLRDASGKQGTSSPHQRRDHGDLVVITTLCMLAQTRNEKSSHFQTTMCLYLLACGASRTQFDILNHAGFSLSYPSAIQKIKDLGQSKLRQIVQIAHSRPCMIIWDNLNIAFRVGEQRKASKDHFDNGTTATLVPLFDVNPGGLPLELKAPRTSRRPIIDDIKAEYLLPTCQQVKELENEMIWHIEDILFSSFPSLRSLLGDQIAPPHDIEPIPIHKTEQYPLPTMHIDESSLDGTLEVLETIITRTLEMDADAIKKHGVFICAGDQLSISLLDKASASRRDDTDLVDNLSQYTEGQLGLFHVKMAGDRMVANEFWGTPNSDSPWSLWKINSLLGRKAITAGWKAKSPTPFRPTYDLILSLTLPAHVLDAFRILCPRNSVEEWIIEVKTYKEVHDIAVQLHQQFCSARRVNDLRQLKRRDVPLENIILFIRDALILRALKFSVKRGDIGTVINILAHWMVMFRGTGKMPKYADALFQLLVHLKTMDSRLR